MNLSEWSNRRKKEASEMFTLPIKEKWFNMILFGKKKEEYREIKPYYEVRFQNLFGVALHEVNGKVVDIIREVPPEIRRDEIQEIIFRNGYSKKSKAIIARCTLRIGTGREEWGAEPGKKYFVLNILGVSPFRCNPEKATECPKTHCYINGGECHHTFYQQEQED